MWYGPKWSTPILGNGFLSKQSLSCRILEMKVGKSLILSFVQYKPEAITDRIIPRHAGIQ